MPSVIRALQVATNKGTEELLRRSVSYVYTNCLRSHAPKRRNLVYNGVVVSRCRRFTDFLYHTGNGRSQFDDLPEYESALCFRLRQHVQEGDTTVIVGGGWGVSTVTARRQVGASGSVITFEGARTEVEKVKAAIELNEVQDSVRVAHKVVGEAIFLRGSQQSAEVLSPTELPDADVLELDCEGAEIQILGSLEIKPRVIIVETHGFLGAPSDEVRAKLIDLGYEIVNEQLAELWRPASDFCRENGIFVITAKRSDN